MRWDILGLFAGVRQRWPIPVTSPNAALLLTASQLANGQKCAVSVQLAFKYSSIRRWSGSTGVRSNQYDGSEADSDVTTGPSKDVPANAVRDSDKHVSPGPRERQQRNKAQSSSLPSNWQHQTFSATENHLTGTQPASGEPTQAATSTHGERMRVLNVAEKNDAAKSLAAIMSRGQSRRREGLSKYNKIYEYDYELQGQRCQMLMTSVSGHLLNYDFPASYRKWLGCNPLVLFDCPVVKQCNQDMEPIKKTLQREAQKCHLLVVWTDCDREGENIGFEVIDVCRAVNPNLRVLRARFSEITAASVGRAVSQLQEPDGRANAAVDVRQQLDLRIGAAFTRFQTIRLRRVFPESLTDRLISYGSCQFPTLGFVVERYKVIQSFIPETFWKINVHHVTEQRSVEFNWKRVRLFDQLCCQVLYEKCLETPTATVTGVQSKPKSKWRPVPLDTVELEKSASRKLRITAKETMKMAEKLYTQGFISYPRTETTIFPQELNLAALVQQQTNDPNWGGFAARLLETGCTPRQGKKTDHAHPPIHPTKYAPGLHGDEQRLYEFIVRHFLACLSADAQGRETTVDVDIAGETFSAHGLTITARNYLEVYPYDKWTDKELPVYTRGDQFRAELSMPCGETSPPSLLTEADLIALMDKHGIGTDATHADHIETIKSRLYVGLEGNKFLPGQLGMGLVDGYDSMGFHMSKPNLRAELEADLKRICDGVKDPHAVLEEQIARYRAVFEEAMRQAQKLDAALWPYLGEAPAAAPQTGLGVDVQTLEPVCQCPSCGEPVILKTVRDGAGFCLSCSAFPGCRVSMWMPETVERLSVSEEQCARCPGRPHLLHFTFKHAAYAPYYPRQHTACVAGCDQEFMETVGLRRLSASAAGAGSSQRSADSGYVSSANQSRTGTQRATNQRPLPPAASQSRPPSGAARPMAAPPLGQTNQSRQPLNEINQPARLRPPCAAGGTDDAENVHLCSCGVPAQKLTVRKEGPNTGRQFYRCGAGQAAGPGCNFFLWADDGPPAAAAGGATYSNDADIGGAGDVTCNCGLPPRRCTVQKDGPNKGREFLGCSKPRDQGCRFFQWCDEEPRQTNPPPAQQGGWRPGAGRARGNGRGGSGPQRPRADAATGAKQRAPRKCSRCHQPGHTAPRCPDN